MKTGVVIGFDESKHIAKKISKELKFKYVGAVVRKFPDGESYTRIYNEKLKGKKVFLVLSLDNPNDKIVTLIFLAHHIRALGALKICLIAPYLCYMRQDKQFRKGEVVSNKAIADLFNKYFDEIITVDPHLHRIKNLNQIFKIKTKKVSAVPLIANFVKKKCKNPFIFGPDYESYQWAKKVAKIIGCGVDILKKHRYSSESVRIKIKEKLNLKDKDVVIVDDIISTGHTMMEVIRDAKKLGAKRVLCICIHGLFVENALNKIKKLNAEVYSTNTILSEVSKIDISKSIIQSIIKR
ncbi:MAG: ribose-phosphate diphosphokinase [Candidatus Woesearchaeota archaeon]|nr:ribose-phosphate diphosphokinase [Candidatus Woesearchaeota archaeon]